MFDGNAGGDECLPDKYFKEVRSDINRNLMKYAD